MKKTLIKSGQEREYADSVSVYIIECDKSSTEKDVLDYLKPEVRPRLEATGFLESYYELKKIEDGKFEYKYVLPYTG